ncbi:MAG: hypothetical protein V3S55_12675 [Nitrospiraceae bacterium]
MDARKLYLKEGCSSMFLYCTAVLHFSEPAAYHPIAAARAARCYPALLERLGSSEIHLSGITLLAHHFTQENHVDLLEQARHKSKRAIEALVADLRPRPAAASYVRRLPPRKRPSVSAPARRERSDVAPPSASQPSSAPAPKPLGAERFRIQFTATRATHDRLRELQALLRHQIPDGDLSQIFERALELLVADVKRKKFAESCSRAQPKATLPGMSPLTSSARSRIATGIAASTRLIQVGAAIRRTFSGSTIWSPGHDHNDIRSRVSY